MDPIPIKILKFQAIHKQKKHQNQPLIHLFFYCLATLTCGLFFSSPVWFPSFLSSMKGFFFGFFQMMSSVFLSSKFVFILGNLIVLALVGESKIFSTVSSSPNIHVEYEENIKRCQRFQPSSIYIEKEPEKVNCVVEERVLLKMSSSGDGEQAIEGKGCKEPSKELLVVEEVEDDIDDEDEELISLPEDQDDELSLPEDQDDDLSLPEDQHFNKRADDFIARVNERRRYELLLCNE